MYRPAVWILGGLLAASSIAACTGSSGDDDDDGFSPSSPTPTGSPTATVSPIATPPASPFSAPIAWTQGAAGDEIWFKLDTNFKGDIIAWRVVDEVGSTCDSTIATTGFPTEGRSVVSGGNIVLPWQIPDNDYATPGCGLANPLRFDIDYTVDSIVGEYFEESFLAQTAAAVPAAPPTLGTANQTNVAATVHGFRGTTGNLRIEGIFAEAVTLEFIEFYDSGTGAFHFGCDDVHDPGLPFPYPLEVNSGYQIVDVCEAPAPVASPFNFDLGLWGFSGDGTTFFQYVPMSYDSQGSPTL